MPRNTLLSTTILTRAFTFGLLALCYLNQQQYDLGRRDHIQSDLAAEFMPAQIVISQAFQTANVTFHFAC